MSEQSCQSKSIMPTNDFDCHKIIDVAEMFLSEEFSSETYQKITDIARQIVSAKYAIFNLYEDNGQDYYSVAVSGTSEVINKASKILGFEIGKKKWGNDPHKAMKIADEIPNNIDSFRNNLHIDDRSRVMKYLDGYLKGEYHHYHIEFRMKHKDGSYRWMLARGEALYDENGIPYRMAGSHTDITEKKEMEKRLESMASTDELTGLWNRRYFFEIGHNECKRTRRYKAKFGMLMIDIDHFKNINDTYGHAAGDAVLRNVAEVFKKGLRDVDIAARIGGEEFAVLMPNTDIEGAKIVAERLRNAVESSQVVYEGNALKITISAGISDCSNVNSIDEMLKNADDALYEAKESGRNCVKMFTVENPKHL